MIKKLRLEFTIVLSVLKNMLYVRMKIMGPNVEETIENPTLIIVFARMDFMKILLLKTVSPVNIHVNIALLKLFVPVLI